MRCSKCHDLKLATPAYYCSKECQVADWERHKIFHKRMKSGKVAVINSEAPAHYDPTSEFQKLIGDAIASHHAGDCLKARRLLEKAKKLKPGVPTPHVNLGTIYMGSGCYKDMVREYTETMHLTENYRAVPDSGVNPHTESGAYPQFWALAAADIFKTFRQHGAAMTNVEIPDWMKDPDKLLATAERATKQRPEYWETWMMLGNVLEDRNLYVRAMGCYKKGKKVLVKQLGAQDRVVVDFQRHIDHLSIKMKSS